MRILILNGPNLNLLGMREPGIYGDRTYADLVTMIEEKAAALGVTAEVRQTNHEGVLVDWIQEALGAFDGIVINPAAYTHTSVAILDAVKSVSIPTVEIHISKVEQREDFRQVSFIRQACIGTVTGLGTDGYLRAIDKLEEYYASRI